MWAIRILAAGLALMTLLRDPVLQNVVALITLGLLVCGGFWRATIWVWTKWRPRQRWYRHSVVSTSVDPHWNVGGVDLDKIPLGRSHVTLWLKPKVPLDVTAYDVRFVASEAEGEDVPRVPPDALRVVEAKLADDTQMNIWPAPIDDGHGGMKGTKPLFMPADTGTLLRADIEASRQIWTPYLALSLRLSIRGATKPVYARIRARIAPEGSTPPMRLVGNRSVSKGPFEFSAGGWIGKPKTLCLRVKNRSSRTECRAHVVGMSLSPNGPCLPVSPEPLKWENDADARTLLHGDTGYVQVAHWEHEWGGKKREINLRAPVTQGGAFLCSYEKASEVDWGPVLFQVRITSGETAPTDVVVALSLHGLNDLQLPSGRIELHED